MMINYLGLQQWIFVVVFSCVFSVSYSQDLGESFFTSYGRRPEAEEWNIDIKTPIGIDCVKNGAYYTYFPKGFSRNNMHTGIWNAIPFVVLHAETLKLRFGLIFEHRQVGILPESWVETYMTAPGMPNLVCDIPATKTFLDFTQGSAQWRATVVLSEEQINILKTYAFSEFQGEITVLHQFTDGSSRPYFISQAVLYHFQLLLTLYEDIRRTEGVHTISMSKNNIQNDFFYNYSQTEDMDYETEILPMPEGDVDTLSVEDVIEPNRQFLSQPTQNAGYFNDTYDDFGEYEYY